MRQQFPICRAFARTLRRQLKNNAAITLSPEDYEGLFIHRNKTTRTRILPPAFAQAVVLTGTDHLACRF